MSYRAALLLLTLLAAIGAWSWFAIGWSAAAPPQPPTTNAPLEADASAAEASGARSDVAAEPATTRREAGDATGAQPLPEDAEWLDLIVVDEQDEPVAGADVYWHDEHGFERLVRSLPPGEINAFGVFWHQPERMHPRAGWRTQSDADGRARVTLGESGSVVAMHEGRYGRLDLRPRLARPAEGLRLTVRPDRSLDVRVVDDLGRPCDDVPVTLAAVDADGQLVGAFGWAAMAITGADGSATIPHLQELASAMTQQVWLRLAPHRVVARVLLPGALGADTPIALDAPPAAPVELRLPACGSILARARAVAGGVPHRAFSIALAEAPHISTPYMSERAAAVGEDGWARFRHVPIGLRFTIADSDQGTRFQEFAGPTSRDQEIDVVVDPPQDAVLLCGSVLDEDGLPVAGEPVWIQLRGPECYEWAYVRSDDDGRFQAVVVGLETPVVVDRFVVRWRQEAPFLSARLPQRTLVSGMNQLGELRPETGEPLLAGRLLVAGEPLTKSGTVWLERFEPAAEDPDHAWFHCEDADGYVARDGSFAVRGSSEPGRHRLCISTEHALPHEPVEVRLGDTDIRIELEPAATAAASLLLPPETPTDQLVVELVGAPDAPGGEPRRLRSYVRPIQGERHGIDWTGVPPGRYTLEVRDSTARRPAVRVPDVDLPLPAAGDARLVDIDLRALLRVVELHVEGPEGAPLAGTQCVAFPVGQPRDGDWLGILVQQVRERAVGLLLLPAGPYELMVTAKGFRPTSLRGDAATATARLGAWSELIVQIADAPPLPEHVSIEVHAFATERTDRQWRGAWAEESLDELLGGIGPAAAVDGGIAKVRCGDGMVELRVWLQGPSGAKQLAGVTPAQVLSTAGRVTVRVPAAAWQEAMAAVAAERR